MAQDNPFAKYVTPAQPAADPVIAVDPYRVRDEQRKEEDQVLQRRSSERADAAAMRAARADERAAAAAERAAEEKPTEAQAKTAVLLTRIVGGFRDIQSVTNRNPDAQEPGLIENVRGDLTPGGWTGAAVRGIAGADRRTVHDSQRDVLDALLTLGTGAAYNAEQLTGQTAAYFPSYGDGPQEIAVKNDRLRRLIEAAKANAGPNWQEIEQAIEPYMQSLSKPAGQDVPPVIDDENGLQLTVTDDSPAEGPRSPGGPTGGTKEGGLSDLAQQGVTLGLSDEAAGVGGYLSGFLTGEDPSAAYVRERDAARARIANAREQYPVLGTAVEFLGGGAAARVAAPVANALGSVVRQGAGVGALGGFGYGEGSRGSVGNALGGAAVGGALGGALYGAGRAVNAFSSRRQPVIDTSVVEAGQRQGIPIRQPDARPELRNQMAEVEGTDVGGAIIAQARAADETAIENRVMDLGGNRPTPDPYALGSRVQEAGSRYRARTKDQAARLYDRARREAGDAKVQPTEALAAIDANIAELQAAGANSNAGQISYLKGLREDFNRPLGIEDVQARRTNLRGQLAERNLTATDAERRVMQVIDAANQDLARDLPRGASSALRAADDFYRERQTFINGTLKEFMGSRGNPLDAETAGKRLISMAQGGGKFDKFSAMWKQLEPDEQADVAATIAASLGRKNNGEFSVATLIKSLDPRKGINPRTARLVFGPDGAKALEDLRQIAVAKTDTQQSLNNSRTGVAVNAAAGGLKKLLWSAFGFAQGGAAGAVAAPMTTGFLQQIGEQRAARMLLNPDFTKWLRRAPNTTNPQAINRYFSRLSGTLASNDNQAFTQALMKSLDRPYASVAASDNQGQQDEK